jgi:hypothetical protein
MSETLGTGLRVGASVTEICSCEGRQDDVTRRAIKELCHGENIGNRNTTKGKGEEESRMMRMIRGRHYCQCFYDILFGEGIIWFGIVH